MSKNLQIAHLTRHISVLMIEIKCGVKILEKIYTVN